MLLSNLFLLRRKTDVRLLVGIKKKKKKDSGQRNAHLRFLGFRVCKHSKECVGVLAAKAGSPQWSEGPPARPPPGRLIHTPSSGAFGGRARGPGWGVFLPCFPWFYHYHHTVTVCIHLSSVVASSDENCQRPRWTSRLYMSAVSEPVARSGASSALVRGMFFICPVTRFPHLPTDVTSEPWSSSAVSY